MLAYKEDCQGTGAGMGADNRANLCDHRHFSTVPLHQYAPNLLICQLLFLAEDDIVYFWPPIC